MRRLGYALLWFYAATFLRGGVRLRVGYFPNITHAQALVARAMAAEGHGWFEQRLGPDVQLEWFAYNAGPSAMEAIFARSIDLTYVGPSPAINAFVKSEGEEIRIISGAARGGSVLLVRPDAHLTKPEDFRGKKMATPQLGNTQDVAARTWLRKQGFHITQLGGDVYVLPTANPDQLGLFQRGELDAVWTVEPWASRLEQEAGAKVYLEQDDVVTTVLVARADALKEKSEVIAKFAKAHRELTIWIQNHPQDAKVLVQKELTAELKHGMKTSLIDASWKRLTFSTDLNLNSIETLVNDARALHFIRGDVDLAPILQLSQ
jgi:NitT/TauT family transport system substrate-binding protein